MQRRARRGRSLKARAVPSFPLRPRRSRNEDESARRLTSAHTATSRRRRRRSSSSKNTERHMNHRRFSTMASSRYQIASTRRSSSRMGRCCDVLDHCLEQRQATEAGAVTSKMMHSVCPKHHSVSNIDKWTSPPQNAFEHVAGGCVELLDLSDCEVFIMDWSSQVRASEIAVSLCPGLCAASSNFHPHLLRHVFTDLLVSASATSFFILLLLR
eukprot:6186184-Pleurochrysis_carterae.AAC.5